MSMGEKVKRHRKELSLSQKELAERLMIGQSTLACYETNRRQIPYDILIALAQLFDVTTDYLLGLENI